MRSSIFDFWTDDDHSSSSSYASDASDSSIEKDPQDSPTVASPPSKLTYTLTDGGNESIDILAASGLLHKKGKMGRNESKKRKSNWLKGDMERRKEKSSAARNDIKGIESWKYEEDQKVNSSAMVSKSKSDAGAM